MGQQQSKQSQQQSPFFHIASYSEAPALLREANDLDGYIDACSENKANQLSRQEMTYYPYRLSASDTASLQIRIESFLSSIPPRFKEDKISPVILTLMPSADGGMPHTRSPNIVCLPYTAHTLSLETYVHELWHIHQRQYASLWSRFLKEGWGFKPFSEENLPESLSANLRLNPDTVSNPLYIWRDEWVPLCVFLNPMRPSLNQTEVWFFNARTRIHYKQMPVAFRTFFSSELPSSAYEHPYEIAAYMLGNSRPPACDAYAALIEHLGVRAKIGPLE